MLSMFTYNTINRFWGKAVIDAEGAARVSYCIMSDADTW